MKLSRICTLGFVGVFAVGLAACDEKDSANANEGKDDGKQTESGSSSPDGGKGSKDDSKDGTSGAASVDVASVTLNKTGGFAGATESIEVAGDGTWSYTKNRMAPKEGKLSGDERKDMLKLVSVKTIADVDKKKSDKTCNDMPLYDLSVEVEDAEPFEIKTDKCGVPPNDEFGQVIELLTEATPI